MHHLINITPDIDFAVPDNHSGRCKLIYDGRSAVFPDLHEAERAANFAVNPTIGGYSEVRLEPTTEEVTYMTVDDWIILG